MISLAAGSVLECYHPYGHVVLPVVYQTAQVFGALGHSYLWPYKGLIGCSPGTTPPPPPPRLPDAAL